MPVDDEAAGRIVGRDRDGDAVAEHDADPVASDLARELGQDLVAVVELDPKVSAFRDQDDFAVEMYELFFAHRVLSESDDIGALDLTLVVDGPLG